MRRRSYLGTAVAGLGLVASAGCIGDLEVASESRTIDALTAGTTLEIENRNGDVVVDGEDRGDGHLQVTKRTRRGVDLDRVSVTVAAEDGQVRLAPSIPSDVREGWVSLDVHLTVPGGVAVDRVRTENGTVDVSETAGDPTLRSSNGDVRARDVAGVVHARTTNGDVTVRDTDGVGDVESVNGDLTVEIAAIDGPTLFETVNGDIDVTIAPGVDCSLSASVTNGEIEITGLGFGDGTTNRGSVSGRIGEGGPSLEITTQNGRIEVSGA